VKITMKRRILFINAEEVRSLLPMKEAIEAMRRAFSALSSDNCIMPERSHIDVKKHKGAALFMPSYLVESEALAVKVVTLFSENPEKNLPLLQALVLLLNGETGTPLAVIEGTSLTAIRTGAASGLATELLSLPEASCAAVFGAGIQAQTQLEAVSRVRRIKQVKVFDIDRSKAKEFAESAQKKLELSASVAQEPRNALKNAQIVCCATTSRTPVFEDADVEDGTHINAIGSYKPDVQEVPEATVRRAYVVVDHIPSALAEAGDLIVPIEKGIIGRDHIKAEIGQIALGLKPGRSDTKQITLFKSVGVAVQDAETALLVYRRALEKGKGKALGF